MPEKHYDVLIIGSLANHDVLLAEHLSRKGVKCLVLRKHLEKGSSANFIPSYYESLTTENMQYYRNSFEFLTFSRKARLIVSFTGALIGALRYLWFLRKAFFLPPVINITTGSDITELAASASLYGILYRKYLKFVNINWCTNYPNAIKNIFRLNLRNVVFMRYPYYLDKSLEISDSLLESDGRIRFFHPTHLDWRVNDPGKDRNYAKGNDKFLRAFIRAVKDGFPGYCVILDRGPDREIAKKIISDAGAKEYFIWKSELSHDELFEEYRKAGVVVDQFEAGGLGGIAIEAMSVGKPVMIYVQENCMRLLYPELPPILNCKTEDEIYAQIIKSSDENILRETGAKAREWTNKYHSWENCLDQFLFYYSLLTGHKIIDYGWR